MTIDEVITASLQEDVGGGDYTTLSTVPKNHLGKAKLLVKEKGVIAGIDIARRVFLALDSSIQLDIYFSDGDEVKPGDIVFVVSGPSGSLLTAERTVLNFMQRMSGIASQTRILADRIKDLPTRILDTRKTTPLLREFEKMAVCIGGGENHRFGLYDMILIKDNHVDFAGGIPNAIQSAKKFLMEQGMDLQIEIETRNLKEVEEVLQVGGISRIMLDNFTYPNLRKAVEMIGDKYETEASGGITLDTIREYAECGVDFVSIGALTHHINSLDLSLKAI